MSKKSGGKRAQDGDAQAMGAPPLPAGNALYRKGAEFLLNIDKSVVARCMIDAGDDIPTRKKKLAQFFRDMPIPDSALARAQAGDREELARHLEKGGDVTDDVRNFLADVLWGKKRGAYRPPTERVDRRNKDIALMVLLLKEAGVRATAAKQLAAEKFNLDFRSIQRASAKWESFVAPTSSVLKTLLAATFGADETTVRVRILASKGVSPDEVRALVSPRRQSGQ
jgi:hypothetical protein